MTHQPLNPEPVQERIPRVSIGLAVRNGQKYLEQALMSILGQTFTDFELVISDNASTDATAAICDRYAANDSRIRYSRNSTDIGGANNENLTFTLSRGEYFHWAAYDDICAPELIEKCVAALDADPSAVLCFSTVVDIDEHGNPLKTNDRNNAESERPHERFHQLIRMEHMCEETYGLIRSSVLRKTKLQQNYTDSDRTLLSELGLYGKFLQLREPLFFRRFHPDKSTIVFPVWRDRMVWFDSSMKDRIVCPHWLQFFDYLRTISRVPLPLTERMLCYLHMVRWLFVYRHVRWMGKDLLLALQKWIRRMIGRFDRQSQLTL